MFRFHGHNLVPRAPLGFTVVWAFGERKEAPREESLGALSGESGAGWLGCPPHIRTSATFGAVRCLLLVLWGARLAAMASWLAERLLLKGLAAQPHPSSYS